MLFTDEASDNELSNDHKKPHITPQHIQILTDLLTDEGEHAKKRHSHHTEENPKRHKHIKIDAGNGDIKELIDMKRIKSMKRHHKFHDINSVSQHEFKNFEQWFEDSETRRVIRSVDFPESKGHKRRSIYDNELPYEKLHIHKEHTITEEPKELTTDASRDDEEDDQNLIPYPPGMKRKRKKKSKRGKKRNQRSKTTKFPDEWHQVS